MPDGIQWLTTLLLDALVLIGVIAGIFLVLSLVARIVRSFWAVTIGKATLVLPFVGSEQGAATSSLLSQQLPVVESRWRALSHRVRELESSAESDAPILVDIGRSQPDQHLDEEQDRLILEDPLEAEAIAPVSFAGISFEPASLFAALYQFRRTLARRAIRGTLHEFGSTVRLSTSFTFGREPAKTAVLVRELGTPGEMLAVVDDASFSLAKIRMGFESEATSWSAYQKMLEGYIDHRRFLSTGLLVHREAAIELYSAAIAAQPDYRLAHYNLGTLLYNRYTDADNTAAIEHMSVASATRSEDEGPVRALSLALLALCHCQRTHRYGSPQEPSATLADEASAMAVDLAPTLEETCFARAFAYQAMGRIDDAIEWYERVVQLPGDAPEELRIKSFARNNLGYVYLTIVGDLERAETCFLESLGFAAFNKMAHANLGAIWSRRGDYQRSLDEYAQALALDPRYVNAMNETGMVHVRMAAAATEDGARQEHLEAARRWHTQAVALVPATAHQQLAELHRLFGEACRDAGSAEDADRERAEADAELVLARSGDPPITSDPPKDET